MSFIKSHVNNISGEIVSGSVVKRPYLYVNFARISALPSFFSFSRNQTANYTDSSGAAAVAAVNEIRFDHDSSGNPMGVLLEDLTNDDLLTIDGLLTNKFPWWNEDECTIIARYRIGSVTAANKYTFHANDGSTNNTQGMRSAATTGYTGALVRTGAVSQISDNFIDIAHPVGGHTAHALSWSRSAGIVSYFDQIEGNEDVTLASSTPTGLTTLNLGGRNGGSEDLNGHLAAIKIFPFYIRETETIHRLMVQPEDGDIIVGFAGQSLISGLFDGQELGTAGGHISMVNTATPLLKPPAMFFAYNGSTGGSAVLYSNDNTRYWWDDRTDEPGVALLDFYTAMHFTPQVIVWQQGEGDYFDIGVGTVTIGDYQSGLDSVFSHMRATFGNPNLPILICPVGGRTNDISDAAESAAQAVRDYNHTLISTSGNNIEFCAENFDLAYTDDVHKTEAAYATFGARIGKRIAHLMGRSVSGSVVGPHLVSAAWGGGTTVDVTIAHDGGSDITVGGIGAFAAFNGATKLVISTVARLTSTTIRITLSSTPSAAPLIYHLYGAGEGVVLANITVDNLGYPLRTGKVQST